MLCKNKVLHLYQRKELIITTTKHYNHGSEKINSKPGKEFSKRYKSYLSFMWFRNRANGQNRNRYFRNVLYVPFRLSSSDKFGGTKENYNACKRALQKFCRVFDLSHIDLYNLANYMQEKYDF